MPGCYQNRGDRARTLSDFVGGTPLIHTVRHHDGLNGSQREFLIGKFPFLSTVMSQEPTQKSVCICCPSYRPRTTWRLPEIVSVCISACQKKKLLKRNFFKGVAPTSFTDRHRRPQRDIETYLQETASTPMVPYHLERRCNEATTQENPALQDETQTLTMSE